VRAVAVDLVAAALEDVDAVAGVAVDAIARDLDVARSGHGDAVEGAVVRDPVALHLERLRGLHEDAGEAVVTRHPVPLDLESRVIVAFALLHEDADVVAADVVGLRVGVGDLEEEDAGRGRGRVAAAGDGAIDVVAADAVALDSGGGAAADLHAVLRDAAV